MDQSELKHRALKLEADAEARLSHDPDDKKLEFRTMEIRSILQGLIGKPNPARESRLETRLTELENDPMASGTYAQFIPPNKKDRS
jgi:hypothetical protein